MWTPRSIGWSSDTGSVPTRSCTCARGGRSRAISGLFARLRAAYLDLCERQVGKLQHQIAVLKATDDADLADLESEAARLAEKIEARKATLDQRRRHTAIDDEGGE